MKTTYRRFVEDFFLFMEVIRAYLRDNVKTMILIPERMDTWCRVGEIDEGDDLSDVRSRDGEMSGVYELRLGGYWRFDTDYKVRKMLDAFLLVHNYKIKTFKSINDHYWGMTIVPVS